MADRPNKQKLNPESSEPSVLQHLSKPELIQHVQDLQEELRMSRAFSNIADTGANDAILQWRGRSRFLAEKIIPVRLKPIANESLNPEKGEHRIIDGDNLAVMTSLLTDFRGGPTRGFDVIYMDPPYNTGEDVFSYNDDYRLSKTEVKTLRRAVGRSESLVSLDDPTRHTKWINHMAPRLWAAKKLLKSTGVIIVSIDEHELPRLWMLMEEIFGDKTASQPLSGNAPARTTPPTFLKAMNTCSCGAETKSISIQCERKWANCQHGNRQAEDGEQKKMASMKF